MLGSDKQVAKWIPLATRYQLIGSYAQTELGHGEAAVKTRRFYRTTGSGPDSHRNLSSGCPCFTGAGVAAGGNATYTLYPLCSSASWRCAGFGFASMGNITRARMKARG